MTNGFLKHRLGLGLLTTLAALTCLCSCNRDEYITVEYIQAPPEYRNESPRFSVDLPQGTKYNDLNLADGDVVDFTEFAGESEADYMALLERAQEDFRALGFYWPAHDMAMSIAVIRYKTAPGGESTTMGQLWEQTFSMPEMLTYGTIVEERKVKFDTYSGNAYYSRLDNDPSEDTDFENKWDSKNDSVLRAMFSTINHIQEQVAVILKGETHIISVTTAIYDEGESMPEMMDIAIRIAKSIRIKEEVD